MKKLPIGIQTFSKLIEENYLYVDKTRDIYNLLTNGSQYYFISRPRRFGKSLLISTLKAIFSGHKKLFKGLWIYDKIDWKSHPVIHIDFSKIGYKTPEELEKSLEKVIHKIGEENSIHIKDDGNYKDKFGKLIEKLASKNRVVVLVDEYDKPIIDFVDQQEIALKNRDILRNFYTSIKGYDEHIRFAFFTGISKFSRVSVFSGLNNLLDVTISDQFSVMLGYREEELDRYFGQRISRMAGDYNVDIRTLKEKIKEWYNGYSWDGKNFVYNPHSILSFFQEKRFDNYWYASGTPTFLIRQIRKHQTPVHNLDNYETDQSVFDSYDVDKMNVVSLLFQTGYLTIRAVKAISLTNRLYYLSFPNVEVKESFLKHILAEFSGKFSGEIGTIIYHLSENIKADNMEGFFTLIKSVYAAIPYNLFIKDKERYYHTILYLILTLLGINIQAEVQTNQGRIDAVIETQHHIYIMEFKMGTAEEALRQIKDRKYHQKYLSTGKPLKLIGIAFNSSIRNIQNYQIEEI